MSEALAWAWVAQQLREAFPYDSASKFLIFDRGSNFNEGVIDAIGSFGIQPKRTSFRSPWQNGVAERWVGNCRRELLDHVVVLNERHLKRLMSEYVRYYHEDRTHLALAREHLWVVKHSRTPMSVVRSYRRQDSAACIIATIWQLELQHRAFSLCVKVELQERLRLTPIESHSPMSSRRPEVNQQAFPCQQILQELSTSWNLRPMLRPDRILARHRSAQYAECAVCKLSF